MEANGILFAKSIQIIKTWRNVSFQKQYSIDLFLLELLSTVEVVPKTLCSLVWAPLSSLILSRGIKRRSDVLKPEEIKPKLPAQLDTRQFYDFFVELTLKGLYLFVSSQWT